MGGIIGGDLRDKSMNGQTNEHTTANERSTFLHTARLLSRSNILIYRTRFEISTDKTIRYYLHNIIAKIPKTNNNFFPYDSNPSLFIRNNPSPDPFISLPPLFLCSMNYKIHVQIFFFNNR